MSLNPALEGARFCPRCGRAADVEYPRFISCPHCGYGAYYNPKPVAAAIPTTPDGRIILLRRAFDPGKDLWTFPGGFVDLGESVEEAARREGQEEPEIAEEATEVNAFKAHALPWDELAFWSTEQALKEFLRSP